MSFQSRVPCVSKKKKIMIEKTENTPRTHVAAPALGDLYHTTDSAGVAVCGVRSCCGAADGGKREFVIVVKVVGWTE